MCKSLHPSADVERLYWKKKNGGKGLINIEESVRIEKTSSGFYLKEQEQEPLTEVVIEGVISDDENTKHVTVIIITHRKLCSEKNALSI